MRTIRGTYGDFQVDEDGIPRGKMPPQYADITRVNLEGNTETEIDILTVDYWFLKDGHEQFHPKDQKFEEWKKDHCSK